MNKDTKASAAASAARMLAQEIHTIEFAQKVLTDKLKSMGLSYKREDYWSEGSSKVLNTLATELKRRRQQYANISDKPMRESARDRLRTQIEYHARPYWHGTIRLGRENNLGLISKTITSTSSQALSLNLPYGWYSKVFQRDIACVNGFFVVDAKPVLEYDDTTIYEVHGHHMGHGFYGIQPADKLKLQKKYVGYRKTADTVIKSLGSGIPGAKAGLTHATKHRVYKNLLD